MVRLFSAISAIFLSLVLNEGTANAVAISCVQSSIHLNMSSGVEQVQQCPTASLITPDGSASISVLSNRIVFEVDFPEGPTGQYTVVGAGFFSISEPTEILVTSTLLVPDSRGSAQAQFRIAFQSLDLFTTGFGGCGSCTGVQVLEDTVLLQPATYGVFLETYGGYNGTASTMTFELTEVPEPSVGVLLASGLVTVGIQRRLPRRCAS